MYGFSPSSPHRLLGKSKSTIYDPHPTKQTYKQNNGTKIEGKAKCTERQSRDSQYRQKVFEVVTVNVWDQNIKHNFLKTCVVNRSSSSNLERGNEMAFAPDFY